MRNSLLPFFHTSLSVSMPSFFPSCGPRAPHSLVGGEGRGDVGDRKGPRGEGGGWEILIGWISGAPILSSPNGIRKFEMGRREGCPDEGGMKERAEEVDGAKFKNSEF